MQPATGRIITARGPVAQWLEPTAHNGLVAGSSPAGPTTMSLRLPQGLLDRIKVEANKRDVPYQSLIKVWLAEKVG